MLAFWHVLCVRSLLKPVLLLHFSPTPRQSRVLLPSRCLGALGESEGGWPEHVLAMLRSTDLGAITEHPLFFRESGDCEVYGSGCVTLLGDAAHLTAAALGQVPA